MIKKVEIKPWCIACKNCQSICPSIFKVEWKSRVINTEYLKNAKNIIKARDMCPVKVIDVTLEPWVKDLDFSIKSEVTNLIYLTPDTIELKIKAENFEYIPGQYVSLKLKDDAWEFSRSYSIAWKDKDWFILNIKLLKDWKAWKILRNIKLKDEIRYFESAWEFVLQNNNLPKTLIATWTWLAPMISILNNLKKDIKKTVIFWLRFEEDIYYKDKLESFENTKSIITVSRPKEWYTWKVWRVNEYLKDSDLTWEFYICWNPEMVESVRKDLEKLWVKKENIHFESFVSSNKKESLVKDIFVNWNIKWLWIIEWILIILGLISPFILINFAWFYYNLSWEIAWWSVFFIMIIRPLADIFPNILIFRKLVWLRKWLWILSWMIIISHFLNNYNNSWLSFIWYLDNYFSIEKWSWDKIIPRLTEVSAFILTITSNTFSQKLLWVNWKRLQKLAYLYFYAGWIYIYNFWKTEALYCMIIAFILYVIAFLKNKN